MPEKRVPMSAMLEKMIASNMPAKVSSDIEKTTGQPAEGFEAFVRKTLNKKYKK